mgnify:CR=1 FL=1
MTVAVRADSITKSFQHGQRALDAVTLEVEHGEVLVLSLIHI